MKKILLDGKWMMKDASADEYMEAVVPGCVHADLWKNGKIADIFYRDKADEIQWIEEKDWIYERDFEVSETDGAVIVFEGLDTYCDVEINGILVGSCDNMFIEYRFEIGEVLKKGKNHIHIRFYSPIRMVENKKKLDGAFTTERLHTRKMQCTYGWDWVERFVSCGIYRMVYIVYEKGFRCSDAYAYTTHIDNYGAQICVNAEFTGYEKGGEVIFEIVDTDGIVVAKRIIYIDVKQFQTEFNIVKPDLWDIKKRTNRHYCLRIQTNNDVYEARFGIRSLRILQRADKPGSNEAKLSEMLRNTSSGQEYDKNTKSFSFEVILNGRKVMCKGANWVPCEPFPSEEADDKITKILEMSKNAGLNIIRVWGGGVFEKEHFYNECDRLGIMVIQDFLMACGQYPEKEDWFICSLNREAEYITRRLRNHPSLAWWHGDNENAVYGCDTDRDYMGRNAAFKGIMPYVFKNDYTRPFLISSPWGGKTNASKTVGTTHNTQFLPSLFSYVDDTSDGSDYLDYMKEYTARFISEEPCFGAAMHESLQCFMTDDDIFRGKDIWLYHSKGNPALPDETFNYYSRFAQKIFGSFEDGEDFLFKMQYLQYELIRISMENARRNKGYCNGIIYWMLNDCWPAAAGWSLIDYYLTAKSGYYSFKKFADDVIVSIDCIDDALVLYLCNDTDKDIKREITIEEIDTATGAIISKQQVFLCADTEKSTAVQIERTTEDSIVLAECGASKAFYKGGRALLEKCVSPHVVDVGVDSVTLFAEKYVHAVRLSGAESFDDNFFIMKQGESKTVSFSSLKAENVSVTAYTLKNNVLR